MRTTDLVIICVNDDEIINIVKLLPNIQVVHTSGSTDINIFQKKTHCGVFYPLQSLNKDIIIDFKNIPICIEANNPFLKTQLINLGKKLSTKIILLNSQKRKHLHLSAVIASNFSNFSYVMAKKHLQKHDIDFDLLKPLILHSAKKILTNDPILTQTGPAKRGDKEIIEEHLTMLNNKNYRKIYKLLSENILNEYAK